MAVAGLFTVIIVATAAILFLDWDSDGLSGYQELLHGTNMFSKDTDGDGLPDNTELSGWYVHLQPSYIQTSDPLEKDTDSDNLTDNEEFALETDPRNCDTDGDNLSDFFESQPELNPLKYDADNNGSLDTPKFNILKYDSDNDDINDGEEYQIDHGTDTDKDGLPDLLEVEFLAKYGANPNRRDIFVEIDKDNTENSRWLTATEKSALVSVFENAPIENPDGSQGVTLHLFESELVPYVNVWDSHIDNYGNEIKAVNSTKAFYAFWNRLMNYRTYREGFYYCVLGYGESRAIQYGFSFNAGYRDSDITTGFMHELGHCLGLWNKTFDGVDSIKYTLDEYPSTMNYSSAGRYLGYSASGVFNDWEYLENNGFYLRENPNY